MTREEIKETIIKTIKGYRKQYAWKKPAGSTYQYEQGQVVGMVIAFKTMGMLEPADQLCYEILEELF